MELKAILNKFAEGHLSIDEVQKQISIHSIEYVRNNLAQLDMGREIRKGVPEVVFAEGKEYSDIVRIILSAIRKKEKVMVSRIKRHELSKLCKDLKKRNLVLEIGKYSTTILVSQGNHRQTTRTGAKIGILTAGTSDVGVAGMEGALASIVSSIVDVPVIGVPTSIGYGFGSDGMAALASMLQSCAFGLAVVNIDNGVGAGAYAASIANRMVRKRKDKI